MSSEAATDKTEIALERERQEGAEGEAQPPAVVAAKSQPEEAAADDDEEPNEDEDFQIPQRYTRSGRKRAVSFPLKLMKVLSQKRYNDVIAWMPSGKSFTIVDSKRFVAEILPQFFKSAKYSSFTRKLHRWGFVRHYRGEEAGAFYHDQFRRDRQDMVEAMTCNKQEPVKPRSTSAEDTMKATAEARAAFTALSMEDNPRRTFPVIPTRRVAIPSNPVPLPSNPVALPNTPVALPANPMASGLNAAIEREVARRLHEQLEEEAFNRRALALLREQRLIQQQQREQMLLQQGQLLKEQQEQQQRLEQVLAAASLARTPAQASWSERGVEMLRQSVPPMPSMQLRSKPSLPPHMAASASDTQPLQRLPQTNIYGAKTA